MIVLKKVMVMFALSVTTFSCTMHRRLEEIHHIEDNHHKSELYRKSIIMMDKLIDELIAIDRERNKQEARQNDEDIRFGRGCDRTSKL
jgi:hypothetical protein